jgi:hypothetical protein
MEQEKASREFKYLTTKHCNAARSTQHAATYRDVCTLYIDNSPNTASKCG